jgi:hypothetical protein
MVESEANAIPENINMNIPDRKREKKSDLNRFINLPPSVLARKPNVYQYNFIIINITPFINRVLSKTPDVWNRWIPGLCLPISGVTLQFGVSRAEYVITKLYSMVKIMII